MPDNFTAGDLIKTAIGIERSGITFFDIMARTTDSDAARDIFEQFVGMERQHLALFQDMLSQLDDVSSGTTLTTESTGYIRALVEGAVFSNDDAMDEAITQADSDSRALEVGIRAEKDSILFYQAVKDALPPAAAGPIERILDEEKVHFTRLAEIKNRVDNGG
jgi:rubrerythrin